MKPKAPSPLAPAIAAGLAVVCATIVRADLVAHYALDELPGSDDTVTDSFELNDGILIGTDTVTKGITSADPVLGTAYDFPLRAGVLLGEAAEVRPIDQFTISCWIRPDTLNQYDRIFETLSGSSNDGNGIRLDLGGSPGDSVRILLRDGNGSTSSVVTHPLTLLTNGTWYFVAVRYDSTLGDGSALKLTVLEHAATIDTAAITAATRSPGSLGTGPLDLHDTGAFLAADDSGAASSNDFAGGLDDFAIFQTGDVDGVLTDAQLATVANIGALAFDPPAPKPTINSFTTSSSSISSGASVTLSWDVSDSITLSIDSGVGNVDAQTTDGVGSILVTPPSTTVYTLTATNDEGDTTAAVQVVVDGQLLPPEISEFVADNNSSLLDGDGLSSDWIEIHNPNLVPLNISGYCLTDDDTDLTKWRLPANTLLPADGYRVVFASGQSVGDYIDAGGNVHTNFALKASGEYLALIEPDGTTIATEFDPEYPAQEEDVSYGPDGYFLVPTPGAPNTGAVLGFVADTTFSVDRGFYDTPFSVAITSATPGAEIWFTTDGSVPSPTNGTLYAAPIPVSTTTVLRAAAFKTDYAPTNTDCQTYIFLADVLRQPNTHAGYPAVWAGEPADYEMDPDIVADPAYSADMIDALQAFPSLSIAIEKHDMFGSLGIYQNPKSQGDAWERPVSAELIIPDGSEPGFQLNAGMRIQGGSSRNPDIPKHSLSLRFRREYGYGKLDYPFLADAPRGDSAVGEFDFLQLRAGFNFGWCHRHYYQARHAQYNRDQFVNDLYLAMGRAGTRGRWVHLYINGIYWGIYHAHERPDADYMASYFGGESDDYDALNSGNAVNGDKVAWNAMIAIADGNIADPAEYAEIQQYLDVDSLIDYIILNFYVGNRDWDGHNWRAARKRETGAGYLFFPWDSEFAISPNGAGVISSPQPLSAALSADVSGKNTSGRPTGLHRKLVANTEYLLRFADRAHKHLHNGGALSPTAAGLTWETRSDLMDNAIIAESARWGDFRVDVDPGRWLATDFALFTKNDHYLPDQTWITGTYIPQRGAVLLGQLRSRGFYPATDPPDFSQHGGAVAIDFPLTITNPNTGGTIYYTLDGSDPRAPNAGGNLVSATAIPYTAPPLISQSGTVKARVLNGTEWSALNEALFLAGPLAAAGNLVVSEIMYNPAGTLEDNEFIELMNISPGDTIDLGNATFVDGIAFTFAPNTLLAPGERILLVANIVAFEAEHGTGLPVAGEYSGLLANEGDTLILHDAFGVEILNFRYNDSTNWPQEADGLGNSLVLRSPTLALDPDDPLSWRSSSATGGNPGNTDSTTFSGDPFADADHDGRSALLEYSQGTSDSVPDLASDSCSLVVAPDQHVIVTCRVNLRADDLDIGLYHCSDFASWTPLAGYTIDSLTRDFATGTALITWRSIDPTGPGQPREFVRWQVATLPGS